MFYLRSRRGRCFLLLTHTYTIGIQFKWLYLREALDHQYSLYDIVCFLGSFCVKPFSFITSHDVWTKKYRRIIKIYGANVFLCLISVTLSNETVSLPSKWNLWPKFDKDGRILLRPNSQGKDINPTILLPVMFFRRSVVMVWQLG